MSLTGFWLPCRLRNLYFIPLLLPWMRSEPPTWGSRHTLVTPTSHLNFARSFDHSSPESGRRPSMLKYGRPPGSPCRFAYPAIFTNASGGG